MLLGRTLNNATKIRYILARKNWHGDFQMDPLTSDLCILIYLHTGVPKQS